MRSLNCDMSVTQNINGAFPGSRDALFDLQNNGALRIKEWKGIPGDPAAT